MDIDSLLCRHTGDELDCVYNQRKNIYKICIIYHCNKYVISGILGMILIAMFTINAGFSGTRLGLCWVMLEERWAFLAYLAYLAICLFSLFAYLSLGLFAYLPF